MDDKKNMYSWLIYVILARMVGIHLLFESLGLKYFKSIIRVKLVNPNMIDMIPIITYKRYECENTKQSL